MHASGKLQKTKSNIKMILSRQKHQRLVRGKRRKMTHHAYTYVPVMMHMSCCSVRTYFYIHESDEVMDFFWALVLIPQHQRFTNSQESINLETKTQRIK